ncbi:MAG: hypothetical protein ACLUTZ_02420 [Oliverpabstia sp.]
MELAEWLQKNECEIVAMESTGSYWKPLYNIMESYGLHAIVVNAGTYESRTRTKDRCKGCRMDCRTAPARIT